MRHFQLCRCLPSAPRDPTHPHPCRAVNNWGLGIAFAVFVCMIFWGLNEVARELEDPFCFGAPPAPRGTERRPSPRAGLPPPRVPPSSLLPSASLLSP